MHAKPVRSFTEAYCTPISALRFPCGRDASPRAPIVKHSGRVVPTRATKLSLKRIGACSDDHLRLWRQHPSSYGSACDRPHHSDDSDDGDRIHAFGVFQHAPSAVVQYNGANRPTSYYDSQQGTGHVRAPDSCLQGPTNQCQIFGAVPRHLETSIFPDDLLNAGTAQITLMDNGKTSNSLTLTIVAANPAPRIARRSRSYCTVTGTFIVCDAVPLVAVKVSEYVPAGVPVSVCPPPVPLPPPFPPQLVMPIDSRG